MSSIGARAIALCASRAEEPACFLQWRDPGDLVDALSEIVSRLASQIERKRRYDERLREEAQPEIVEVDPLAAA